MLRYTGYALVVVVLAGVSSEAFLNGAGSASATQSAASVTPMRLKGGLVERCTSDKDVGKVRVCMYCRQSLLLAQNRACACVQHFVRFLVQTITF